MNKIFTILPLLAIGCGDGFSCQIQLTMPDSLLNVGGAGGGDAGGNDAGGQGEAGNATVTSSSETNTSSSVGGSTSSSVTSSTQISTSETSTTNSSSSVGGGDAGGNDNTGGNDEGGAGGGVTVSSSSSSSVASSSVSSSSVSSSSASSSSSSISSSTGPAAWVPASVSGLQFLLLGDGVRGNKLPLWCDENHNGICLNSTSATGTPSYNQVRHSADFGQNSFLTSSLPPSNWAFLHQNSTVAITFTLDTVGIFQYLLDTTGGDSGAGVRLGLNTTNGMIFAQTWESGHYLSQVTAPVGSFSTGISSTVVLRVGPDGMSLQVGNSGVGTKYAGPVISPSTNITAIKLGGAVTGSFRFTGGMEKVAVWNRAVSDSEAQDIHEKLVQISSDKPERRIWALGDSITEMSYSYRETLFRESVMNGKFVVDMQGQNHAGDWGSGDVDNEGHSGYRIDQILANLDSYATFTNSPTDVIIMLGTNDCNQSYDLPNAGSRLTALVNAVKVKAPGAMVWVSRIPISTNASLNARINTYNATVTNLAGSVGYSLLDANSMLLPEDMKTDQVHPLPSGGAKIGHSFAVSMGL